MEDAPPGAGDRVRKRGKRKTVSLREIRPRGFGKGEANELVQRYPSSTVATVLYDPNDPKTGYLEADLDFASYVIIISRLIFVRLRRRSLFIAAKAVVRRKCTYVGFAFNTDLDVTFPTKVGDAGSACSVRSPHQVRVFFPHPLQRLFRQA